MRITSVVLLTIVGVLMLAGSFLSTGIAYRGSEPNVVPGSLRAAAADQPDAVVTLRGRRATAAAFSGAFAALFLVVALIPYRRGDVWAWWALLLSTGVLFVLSGLRVPLLSVRTGAEVTSIVFGVALIALLLDLRRLRRP